MKIVFYGTARSKKNSQQIFRGKGGRPFITQSQQYKDYERMCLNQIMEKHRQRIDSPVNVQCVFYMPTRRKVDITNLTAAVHDILVKGGVLADDNRNIVAGMDGSRVFYDRDKPRVEIEITPMMDYTQWQR